MKRFFKLSASAALCMALCSVVCVAKLFTVVKYIGHTVTEETAAADKGAKFVSVQGAKIVGLQNSETFVAGREIEIRPFLISDQELTQAEYEKYCFYSRKEPNETEEWQKKICPVYNVTWSDAVVYCNLRSIDEGLEPVYSVKGETDPKNWKGIKAKDGKFCYGNRKLDVLFEEKANGYRLPTEVEWEYAALGGQEGIKNGDYEKSNLFDVAWFQENSGTGEKKTQKTYDITSTVASAVTDGTISAQDAADLAAVGVTGNADAASQESRVSVYTYWVGCAVQAVKQKAPNRLGLYDMLGNVGEYCWDFNSPIKADTPAVDYNFPKNGFSKFMSVVDSDHTSAHVSRGGYYYSSQESCNPFTRRGSATIGIRLVRNAE